MKKQSLRILSLVVLFSACMKPKTFMVDNYQDITSTHQKIAILPFQVNFNKEYKESPYRRGGPRRDANYWVEQERLAALDMQKEMFVQLAGQVEKGRIVKVLQPFTETNNLLAEAGITIYDLPNTNKAKIARVLGVDAIMTGTTDIVVYPTGMGMGYGFNSRQGGVNTKCEVYDGLAGELIWSDTISERPNSQFDTPSRLAAGTLRQFAKHNPYWAKR